MFFSKEELNEEPEQQEEAEMEMEDGYNPDEAYGLYLKAFGYKAAGAVESATELYDNSEYWEEDVAITLGIQDGSSNASKLKAKSELINTLTELLK